MDPPSDTIWVGNLPMTSDEATIKAVFAAYGTISRVKPLAVSNGKGAAIIQLTDVAEATWIVENLNGNIAQGLTEPIIVKFARPQGAKGAPRYAPYGDSTGKGGGDKGYTKGGGGGGGEGGGQGIEALMQLMMKNGAFPQVDRSTLVQLYVSGLPPDTTDTDLYRMFAPFGCPIRPNGVKAMLREDGSCTGVGFVDVYDAASAQMAMNAMSGTMLPDGKVLKVQQKRNQGQGGKGGDGEDMMQMQYQMQGGFPEA